MKLGFIGTGKITSAVINGICSSSISYNKIIISHRNKSTSSTLKKKFKKITISKDNQEIINSCDWIFLSLGAIIILGFAGWEFLDRLIADQDVHPLLKWGIFIFIIGVIILLISISIAVI